MLTEAQLRTMIEQAKIDPLGVDISDYGDEWCAGFLAGQVNALEWLLEQGLSDVPADKPTA